MPNYHEKSYSEATAEAIDKQVRSLMDAAYLRAVEIIQQNRAMVELMARMLIEFESLDRQDVLEIRGGTFDIEKNGSASSSPKTSSARLLRHLPQIACRSTPRPRSRTRLRHNKFKLYPIRFLSPLEAKAA